MTIETFKEILVTVFPQTTCMPFWSWWWKQAIYFSLLSDSWIDGWRRGQSRKHMLVWEPVVILTFSPSHLASTWRHLWSVWEEVAVLTCWGLGLTGWQAVIIFWQQRSHTYWQNHYRTDRTTTPAPVASQVWKTLKLSHAHCKVATNIFFILFFLLLYNLL